VMGVNHVRISQSHCSGAPLTRAWDTFFPAHPFRQFALDQEGLQGGIPEDMSINNILNDQGDQNGNAVLKALGSGSLQRRAVPLTPPVTTEENLHTSADNKESINP
jgi:hypothetical protein